MGRACQAVRLAVVVLWRQARLRIVKVFVANTGFSAEREIRIATLIQRNVFDWIEQVVAGSGAKIRVVFVVAELAIGAGGASAAVVPSDADRTAASAIGNVNPLRECISEREAIAAEPKEIGVAIAG
jgi:hypothetical protein